MYDYVFKLLAVIKWITCDVHLCFCDFCAVEFVGIVHLVSFVLCIHTNASEFLMMMMMVFCPFCYLSFCTFLSVNRSSSPKCTVVDGIL